MPAFLRRRVLAPDGAVTESGLSAGRRPLLRPEAHLRFHDRAEFVKQSLIFPAYKKKFAQQNRGFEKADTA